MKQRTNEPEKEKSGKEIKAVTEKSLRAQFILGLAGGDRNHPC